LSAADGLGGWRLCANRVRFTVSGFHDATCAGRRSNHAAGRSQNKWCEQKQVIVLTLWVETNKAPDYLGRPVLSTSLVALRLTF
jgi:hypothetical protein